MGNHYDGLAAFNQLRALSTRNENPAKACRPFDLERDGFVLGEGSAVLILEDLDYALQRGATILAEIIGYGATSDAFHIIQPEPNGESAVTAMRLAMERAGIQPEDIDYINAHGTATVLNDRTETHVLKKVLGKAAYRIPISATKSMTGHLIGACGALEAMICIMAINHGQIPPTINLEHPDPECDLDYVPNHARAKVVNVALSNSFGFGGHNSVLVFRRYVS